MFEARMGGYKGSYNKEQYENIPFKEKRYMESKFPLIIISFIVSMIIFTIGTVGINGTF